MLRYRFSCFLTLEETKILLAFDTLSGVQTAPDFISVESKELEVVQIFLNYGSKSYM